jgi:hypothetical protein
MDSEPPIPESDPTDSIPGKASEPFPVMVRPTNRAPIREVAPDIAADKQVDIADPNNASPPTLNEDPPPICCITDKQLPISTDRLIDKPLPTSTGPYTDKLVLATAEDPTDTDCPNPVGPRTES